MGSQDGEPNRKSSNMRFQIATKSQMQQDGSWALYYQVIDTSVDAFHERSHIVADRIWNWNTAKFLADALECNNDAEAMAKFRTINWVPK